MSKREFKVGDEVKIKPYTRYYGVDSSNPADKIGKITYIDKASNYVDSHNISIKWDINNSNVYTKEDLELISKITYPDE